MSFYHKIKRLRDAEGWSQEYVSDKIGVSQGAYSKLEMGQTKLTFDRAQQLAKLYEIEPEYFFASENKAIHYGKDNSYGPIENNSNYFSDEKYNTLVEKLLLDKDQRIEEYQNEIKILRSEIEKLNNTLAELLGKIMNKL
jgi:transcriptional regulator with XRE-family HTH domain